MSLIQRNDEVIQVGVTTGLVAGATSFVFDGTSGKPDYRGYEPKFFEYGGRSPMIKGLDYSWNYLTGEMILLQTGDSLELNQYYTVGFQPYDSSLVLVGNVVDYTFFVRKINIPNIDIVYNPKNAPVLERLNSFISQYEPECLTNILGYALYKALLTETSGRMTDLLYGAEYTDNSGVLKKWNGLSYSPQMSLIAQYVYYRFQEDGATQSTGVTTSTNKTEGGYSVSPEYKMLDAWNFFSSETKAMVSFLWNKNQSDPQVYPEFSLDQCYNTLAFSRSTNFFGL